jgi:predicted NodU family carbamoyl transferase
MAEYPSSGLAGSRVELGTERESFLQVLDENANFGGQPAAGRSYGKDRHGSVNSPRDAVRSFYCSGLDALVINGFMLAKR